MGEMLLCLPTAIGMERKVRLSPSLTKLNIHLRICSWIKKTHSVVQNLFHLEVDKLMCARIVFPFLCPSEVGRSPWSFAKPSKSRMT